MANHKDAIKRNKQNQVRNTHNRHYKSMMRTATKKFQLAVENGDTENATKLFNEAASLIHRVGGKGIIHKKQASRRVSRLAGHLKGLMQNA